MRTMVIMLLMTAGSFAQDTIPAGTILPVRLNSSLRSDRTRAGEPIGARVMQDVPLPSGSSIPAGAKVVGQVVSVASAPNRAEISLRFDTLKVSHEKIPITTNLRAAASFMDVEEAQIPVMGPDRATPQGAWTTTQIGGDAVYRGGGPVEGAFGRVGTPVYDGVLDQLNANPDGGCRAAIDSNDAPQALWVFSSNACGAYGLPHLKIAHTGRTDPIGEITFKSTKGQAQIHAGAGLLLRVDSSGASGA